MNTELVIARYKEDLGWLKKILPQSAVESIVIYDKASGKNRLKASDLPDDDRITLRALPNVGRESHTFLKHLSTYHYRLAAVTLFLQGNPLEHCSDIFQKIEQIASDELKVEGFLSLGDVHAWDDTKGSNCFVSWERNQKKEELNICDLWDGLHKGLEFPLDTPCPNWFHFCGGGQFALTRERAQSYGEEFYQHAVELAEKKDWRRSHEFERIWKALFSIQ